MAIAHHDPAVQLTLADDAVTLEGARAMATSIGLSERLTTIEGCYHELELPRASFDMVLMAELLSLEPVDGQRQLLQRASETLKPGGELVLVDLFAGQPEGDLALSILSLEMGLASSQAGPCDPRQLQQLLAEAGFEKITFAHLEAPPHLYGTMVCSRSMENSD
jgi:SAM-dependent methyltransferase